MKKLLLSIVLFVFALSAYSQSGGPDAFGYIWRDNNHPQGPVYNWIDITTAPGAVQVSGLGDDNVVGYFPIGFQFPYYWYGASQFKIGSNGYILFGNGAISATFPHIPSTLLPNDIIAPFMCDFNFSGAGNVGECWYWSNSIDTLIVSWINVPIWIIGSPTYTGANTFQVILSKVDSSITFQYDLQQGASATTSIAIGIENISGTVGLEHSFNTYPPEAYAVKFYYPQGSTFVANDAATVYNNNPETGGLFLSKNGAQFTMNTEIKNTGNQNLSGFPVLMKVVNTANVIQVQQTLTSSALTLGQTEDLTATSTFNPNTAGTFKFQTTTQLTGDAAASNNTKTLELRVIDTTQAFQTLTYTGNTPVPATVLLGGGISWQGGNAGVGIEIKPPYYPCYIRRAEYYILANGTPSNFYSLLYDNTGPLNGIGNLLDSTYVSSGSIVIGQWNSVSFVNPIQIDSGTVYVGWMMDGDGITLGTDSVGPIGNRSYELLGNWSIFRSRETADPMIRLVISASPTAGTENLTASDVFGEFYPSPSNGKVRFNFNLPSTSDDAIFSFYDIQGKLVEMKKVVHPASHQSVSFDLSSLEAGMYSCKIITGNLEYNRKLVIAK